MKQRSSPDETAPGVFDALVLRTLGGDAEPRGFEIADAGAWSHVHL